MAGHPVDVFPAQPGVVDGGHDRPQRQREGAHPEFLDNSVMPIPAMAALSRNGWALTVATLERSG